MAQKKKQTRHIAEVTGIMLLGFAIFLMWCLINYDPRDPSFETGVSAIPQDLWKRGGRLGSYLASFLFQAMGLGAFMVPAVALLGALKVLFKPVLEWKMYLNGFLFLLLFLIVETALSLYPGRLALLKYKFNAGGACVGAPLAALLTGYLGRFGAWLVLFIGLLISIMGLTRISYVTLWKKIADPAGRRFLEAMQVLKERYRTAAARRLLEKKKKSMKLSSKAAPARRAVRDTFNFSFDDMAPVEAEDAAPALVPAAGSEREPLPPQPPIEIPIKVPAAKAPKKAAPDDGEEAFAPVPGQPAQEYKLPPLSLLDSPAEKDITIDHEALRRDAETLVRKLADFGVQGVVVEISPGPIITRFEFEPAPGIKLQRIINLQDDLALAMKAMSVRIAPIPGKSVVGIELPNKKRRTVCFKDIVAQGEFIEAPSRVTIGMGKDIAGIPIISDLARMPHLLVAGTTGSGKSIFVNTIICSILFKSTPAEVRFLMVDPKRIELSLYEGIPHLLHPVVVDPKKAAIALRWAVEEMERRYKRIAEKGTRNIVQYNKKLEEDLDAGIEHGEDHEKMPYIVIIIDELADLMMVAARDVESYIARLAQMARAAGMHLLVATQRPSVDIITGLIKANFPSRISFQVSSKVDSRTIIDTMGAEKLLGMGDMLFMPPGTSRVQRIHGAHLTEKEIKRITDYVKKQAKPFYDESILAVKEEDAENQVEEEYDEFYDAAVQIVTETRQASISMLQRRMRVGYNRAARMIERMEREGVVSPSDGIKPREVLAQKL
ncbi:MAG: DNA translocase FtsK 4TM domain-containing protein [Deltaproteobacteria bacterium]|nr:DNA translocase FtsK 4TM domain-containing protein [Deltaproteobacteria bacterium]